MCGIAGVATFGNGPIDKSVLRRMIGTLRHRGPDDCGFMVRDQIGLAHSRLAIIDPSGGRQPMCNEDRSLWLTFNGEIFNYLELRETLTQRGHRFATKSDTEVILHAYEEYGLDCVRHFNGQWAFALWDSTIERLFLSRDRLGIRPMFYARANGSFVFASEIKAIFAHGAIPRRLDVASLDQVFTLWCTVPPRTAFQGVFELPPAHNMVVDGSDEVISRYWQYQIDGSSTWSSDESRAEELRDLLLDATRLRLRSDVPVAVYLSGGLDSSAVAGMVRETAGRVPSTFSVTFDDPEFDESRYQREATEYFGTDHHDFRCSASDICRMFPDVIWHAEQPVIRSSPAPLYGLASLVHRSRFKVVLTGEGADEMLGGYDIFKEAKIRRFWGMAPESQCRPTLLRRLYPYLPVLQSQSTEYLKAAFKVDEEDLENPYFSHLPRWTLSDRLKLFYSDDLKASLQSYDPMEDLGLYVDLGLHGLDFFSRAQYLETVLLLPGFILSSQGDRMSLAHGVEGRYPFLDHRVAEFAGRLHPHQKMKVLVEKHILKESVRGMVPDAVIQRTKQPYRAPDSDAFFDQGTERQEYVSHLLSEQRLREAGLFDPKAVSVLVEKASKGRTMSVRDNMAVVGILSAQLVFDQFIEGFDRRVSLVSRWDGEHVA